MVGFLVKKASVKLGRMAHLNGCETNEERRIEKAELASREIYANWLISSRCYWLVDDFFVL